MLHAMMAMHYEMIELLITFFFVSQLLLFQFPRKTRIDHVNFMTNYHCGQICMKC